MTQVIQFLLSLAVIVFLLGVLNLLYRRLRLIRVLKRVSSIEGVDVRRLKNPFSSLLKLSQTPEIMVSVYDDIYLIRLYNGVGGGNAVHFATEKFTVCYSRIKTATYVPKKGRFLTLRGFNVGARVKVLPDLRIPDGLYAPEYTEVVLFNPAPTEVSYVVKEKTSIKVAFTGDEIFGRKIFTASTFEIFIDREARRIRNQQNAKA